MDVSVRRLRAEDEAACQRLEQEAFGVPVTPTEPASVDEPGYSWYGSFLAGPGAGDALVAQLAVRDYESWFGGVALPTAGIAEVTVAAEHRGRGTLAPLFRRALTEAREPRTGQQGAVLSTLYPTAPAVYRRLGYEVVTELVELDLPTAALAAVPRDPEVTVRRAGADDVEAIRTVYDRWASEQNGPLTRRGVSFTAGAEEFLAGFTGVTVAVDAAGTVCGYASWRRGQGYDEHAVLRVSDLIALTAGASRTLLATLGSFASVTPTVSLRTSGPEPARLFLPTKTARPGRTELYMLKVLDVVRALADRPYPRSLSGELRFAVAGDVLDQDGGYRLEVSGGQARCERAEPTDGVRVWSPRGLALAYAGVQSCANLRAAGLLSDGDRGEDPEWDALFGGRQAHVRDYF